MVVAIFCFYMHRESDKMTTLK